MNASLHSLLDEVQDLEREIADLIQSEQPHADFKLVDDRPVFDAESRRRQKRFKKSIFRFLIESSHWNVLTAPVIYALAIPLALLDFSIFLYQGICFPFYGIPKVRRRDYVVLDRYRLPYLNLIEKFNCAYCGYANGVVALAREVASRTEQYWCPIKHARKAAGCHARQCLYCDFGAAEAFRRESRRIRSDFSDLKQQRRAEQPPAATNGDGRDRQDTG